MSSAIGFNAPQVRRLAGRWEADRVAERPPANGGRSNGIASPRPAPDRVVRLGFGVGRSGARVRRTRCLRRARSYPDRRRSRRDGSARPPCRPPVARQRRRSHERGLRRAAPAARSSRSRLRIRGISSAHRCRAPHKHGACHWRHWRCSGLRVVATFIASVRLPVNVGELTRCGIREAPQSAAENYSECMTGGGQDKSVSFREDGFWISTTARVCL